MVCGSLHSPAAVPTISMGQKQTLRPESTPEQAANRGGEAAIIGN